MAPDYRYIHLILELPDMGRGGNSKPAATGIEVDCLTFFINVTLPGSIALTLIASVISTPNVM